VKDCNEIRTLFADALYGDLSDDAKRSLDEHLQRCPKCSAIFKKLTRTVSLMERHERVDPGDEFWNGYWDRLSERMDIKKPSRHAWWMARAAAVLLLIGIGVVIGRYYFRPTPSISQNVGSATSTPTPPEISNVDQRVSQFLGRSQVLLLGLVNFDPQKEDLSAVNWQQQKKVSQDLILQAKTLQGELVSPEQRRLQKLVSDLEVVLLQIANLEAQHDLPGIELVKSGVDRKAILLKINLELMRPAPSEEQVSSRRKNAL
jgi:hypothetical protein